MSTEHIKTVVQEKYGAAAKRAASGLGSACCGTSPASAIEGCDPITSNLYGEGEASSVPEAAMRASLGCGNPTALAKLGLGETVLDLGSGGGIDVLLSAKRVGPTGKAYGLDMTDEMLALAEENKKKSGLTNVEFLKGEIENIPLQDNTVDVIVSNCVINLSGDKDRVLREAFRVLKPGGSLYRTWWFEAKCRSKSARAWNCGWAASLARCRIRSIGRNWPLQDSTRSTSNQRACTASTTLENF